MDWTVIGGIFGTVVTGAGAWYAARRTGKSTKEATAVTAAEKLWKRVDELQEDVDGLREKQEETASILSVAVDFVERLLTWGRGGGGHPEPTIPAQLRDRLEHLNETKREG